MSDVHDDMPYGSERRPKVMLSAARWLYLPIEAMPFGSARRALIMAAFDKHEGARYAVNCKYRPQMKADKDLQRLVKEGKLVMKREAPCRTSTTPTTWVNGLKHSPRWQTGMV